MFFHLLLFLVPMAAHLRSNTVVKLILPGQRDEVSFLGLHLENSGSLPATFESPVPVNLVDTSCGPFLWHKDKRAIVVQYSSLCSLTSLADAAAAANGEVLVIYNTNERNVTCADLDCKLASVHQEAECESLCPLEICAINPEDGAFCCFVDDVQRLNRESNPLALPVISISMHDGLTVKYESMRGE